MEVQDNSKIAVSLSNNKIISSNNNSQLQQQQNGHIIPLSFVEKINNSNNLNLNNTSTEKSSNIDSKKPIRLNSPIGASAISWHWSEKEKNNIGIEVLYIIRYFLIF